MKPISFLVLAALAGLATACSATISGASAEAAPAEEIIQTAGAGSEVEGTLNLNIGRGASEPARPIVSSESVGATGGLIVAPGGSGGNFEGVADLGVDIQIAPETVLETPAAKSDEDEVVRLPQQD